MTWWQRKPAVVMEPVGSAITTRAQGQLGEDRALAYLQQQGLRLLARNYRTPGRGGGEIDLIMQARDGTVVFVEVRSRSHRSFGGAGGSISLAKRQRWAYAARHWLQQASGQPACRFDAVLLEGSALEWLQGVMDVEAM